MVEGCQKNSGVRMNEIWTGLSTGERRVVVEAVPGAGKTRLLLDAARDEASLLLAYNCQLAEAMREQMKRTSDTRTLCMTFHALCARCFPAHPARDDAQMERVIDLVEHGKVVPTDVPGVTRVLIDEAQDVRSLYVRLLKAIGLVGAGTSMLVAGDRNQLVYDFDQDYPASLDTLLHTERVFGGAQWVRAKLTETHRLTAPICSFVNSIFGTRMRGVRDGAAVEVRCPKNIFELFGVVKDVLCEEQNVLILVDRKKNNRPLRALLNTVSRRGTHRVRVHGYDAETKHQEQPPTEGVKEVSCGSFWSAKGLECNTALVLLPKSAARNPTYVALTRARERLVVVLDPREPHAAACHAANGAEEGQLVVKGANADAAIALGLKWNALDSFQTKTFEYKNNLSSFVPRRLALTEQVQCTVVPTNVTEEVEDNVWFQVGTEERDLSTILVAMARVMAECNACNGRVRAMEDILHPTRMDAAQAQEAIRAGFIGRHVPRNVTDDALLASDLREIAASAYARLKKSDPLDVDDVAEVALATMAWNDFDHSMRNFLPVDRWTYSFKFRYVLDRALALFPVHGEGVRYDHILHKNDFHCRVHASTPDECVHAVWTASSDDFGAAAVRAAMHSKGTCLLLELGAGRVQRVMAQPRLLCTDPV